MDTIENHTRSFIATLTWAPAWAVSTMVFVTAIAIALLFHRTVFGAVVRWLGRFGPAWQALAMMVRGPTRLATIAIALVVAASLAPLTEAQASGTRHALAVCVIALIAWMARIALEMWTTVYLRRFKLDAEDNLLARKHVTQMRILLRVADVLIVVLATAAVLMTFDGVKQYGVSLLASAGAAGLIFGLALQPVLKNIFAGIQLAITQPIRIDDALLVEGEWGKVEEITSTYVVVRIWDWRRLILPLSYFIEKPFQNWTREGAALIGNVMIYLDYSVPVDVVRKKVEEIAASSPLWDKNVVNIAVTDFKPTVMEIRILVSASNAGRAFDLRCYVREKLIAFLAETYPNALPRLRADTTMAPDDSLRRALTRRPERQAAE